MVPGKDIEDCEVMKHRFDELDHEINTNASCDNVVNQLMRQFLHVDYPGSEEIVTRQSQLNSKWSSLREKSEMKGEEQTLPMVFKPSILSVMKLPLGLRTR